MDWLNKILKAVDHNRYLSIAALLATVILAPAGCESTTPWGGKQATRAEVNQDLIATKAHYESQLAAIQASMEASVKAGELAMEDLRRKDAQRAAALQSLGGLITEASSGNPVGLGLGAVSLLSMLLGGGAIADNRRKDSVIKGLNGGTKPTAPPTA